jgi:hypothetical protein
VPERFLLRVHVRAYLTGSCSRVHAHAQARVHTRTRLKPISRLCLHAHAHARTCPHACPLARSPACVRPHIRPHRTSEPLFACTHTHATCRAIAATSHQPRGNPATSHLSSRARVRGSTHPAYACTRDAIHHEGSKSADRDPPIPADQPTSRPVLSHAW